MIYSFYFDQMIEQMAGASWSCGKISVQVTDLAAQEVISGSMGSMLELDADRKLVYFDLLSNKPPSMRICCAESGDLTEFINPITREPGFAQVEISGLPQDAAPCQAQVVRLASGGFRMYFWLHDQKRKYARYLTAESQDGLNFICRDLEKAILYHSADCALSLQKDSKRLLSNDATFVLPVSEGFELYSVWLAANEERSGHFVPYDNAPRIRRIIHRRTTGDGLSWGDPEIVLWPDEEDPWDLQFYCLAQYLLGPRRMGIIGRYAVEAQTIDLEFAFSADGRIWDRPVRADWLPKEEQFGYGSMLLPMGGLVGSGSVRSFLFAGFNHNHQEAAQGKFKPGVICKGSFQQDKLVGVASLAGRQSQLRTNPFVLTREQLVLSGEVGGRLTASLKDLHGKEIASHLQTELVELEPGRCVLGWEGMELAELMFGDVYRLELAFEDANLFGFEA
ncbi:MAG: hypothetical protein GX766_11015 [Firmicutes bacterium]|nr:hypothetical protein [Bacillota bacterium]